MLIGISPLISPELLALMTGETAKYGNIIQKKGVTPITGKSRLVTIGEQS